MKDGAVARAGGEDVVVPGKTPYSACVTGHSADLLALLGVPDLYFALVGADGEGASLWCRMDQLEKSSRSRLYRELTLLVHSIPVAVSPIESSIEGPPLAPRSHNFVTLLV